MKEMPDNSVDSIVTDPPYELGFMGKSWDSSGIAFNVEVWQEALRVLKPGGHLLAFSGSRTYHRMAVAIEDAGFEIRDQIMWVYGSGFPKSHNISKGIDKAAGFEGEVIGKGSSWNRPDSVEGDTVRMNASSGEYDIKELSPEAQQWQGWGTALKPAHEPIVLARKPFPKGYTVAKNVLEFGTGGLNIDGSRVGSEGGGTNCTNRDEDGNCVGHDNAGRSTSGATIHAAESTGGRWPANFIHDGSDEVNDLFGEPARFFYCAKTSKRDRNEGLDGFEAKETFALNAGGREKKTAQGDWDDVTKRWISQPKANHHPTVKPTDLMRYLCRLITPPNGTVLDPFMGSGSTGKACAYEGFNFIGIEQSAEYVEIARARIEYAQKQEKDYLL